jgi:hypothetical protein
MERKGGELPAGYMYVLVGKIYKFDRVICRTCVRPYGGPAALLVERNKN